MIRIMAWYIQTTINSLEYMLAVLKAENNDGCANLYHEAQSLKYGKIYVGIIRINCFLTDFRRTNLLNLRHIRSSATAAASPVTSVARTSPTKRLIRYNADGKTLPL